MSKKINSLKDIALHYKNFFFDLDGVLVSIHVIFLVVG